MTAYRVYTREMLEKAVKESSSFAGVLRILGLRQASGTQHHIKNMVLKFEIDFSHFLGRGHLRGKTASNKRTPEDILVRMPVGSLRPRRAYLVRSMLFVGVDYACLLCGQKDLWNGKTLVLEVDHVDGDFLNNEIGNLRFLCPNCHSQQDTNKPRRFALVAQR